MKKLLITLLACGALVGCNSGSSNEDNGTYIMSFNPSELSLTKNEAESSTLELINTVGNVDITLPVTFNISDQNAVSITPNVCTISPTQTYCNVIVKRLQNTTEDVIIHPVVPESYSYVEVVDLIVHSESAESAQ